MARDLTFQQLADALPAGAIALSGDTITFSTKLITGDTATALSNTGVAELMQKLLMACAKAQETVNGALPAGERVNAFPQPTFGTPEQDPIDGLYYTTNVFTCQFQLPINFNTAYAPVL